MAALFESPNSSPPDLQQFEHDAHLGPAVGYVSSRAPLPFTQIASQLHGSTFTAAKKSKAQKEAQEAALKAQADKDAKAKKQSQPQAQSGSLASTPSSSSSSSSVSGQSSKPKAKSASQGGKAKGKDNKGKPAEEETQAREPRAPREAGYGTVKEVISGDSLIVYATQPVDGVYPERLITLSGIEAPYLPRGRTEAKSSSSSAPKSEGKKDGKNKPAAKKGNSNIRGDDDESEARVEQPFAWAAREFLRNKTIGQRVYFIVNHKVSRGDDSSAIREREYATVRLGDEDLAVSLLEQGLARVKEPKESSSQASANANNTKKDGKETKGDSKDSSSSTTPKSSEREQLRQFQLHAQQRKLGIWTENGPAKVAAVRLLNWEPDARSLLEKYRGRAIRAIVDQVRDGSTLRCELLGDSGALSHVMITLHLAGVKAPTIYSPQQKAENPNKFGEDEPFAREAQQFTEIRLLNRQVDVILQGIDTFGNFFGSIGFSKGNISLKLLEQGLGRLIPWSAALTGESERYAQAESDARRDQTRIWSIEEEVKEEFKLCDPTKPVVGRVIEVRSGDTITVVTDEKTEPPTTVQYTFASIRCPRLNNSRRDEPAQAWGWEAREYVRRSLIGRSVTLVEEFARDVKRNTGGEEAQEYVETQKYATVIYNKENISEQLVLRGLAELVKHRPHEPRSVYYDHLQIAESKARDSKKGKHGTNNSQRVTDISVGKPKQAEIEVDKLKALPSFEAVVEYVSSGTKYKLYVPGSALLISFILGSVQCEKPDFTKKADGEEESLGNQAYALAKSLVFNHTVRVSVDGIDRGGAFIGALSIGDVSLGARLLQEGFASIYRSGPADRERPKYAARYPQAEAEAKAQQKGIWAEGGNSGDKEESKGESEKKIVRVTEIKDAATFYVHVIGDENVADIEAKMKEFNADVKESPEQFSPSGSGGDIVAGKWAADGDTEASFYRVRIEKLNNQGDKYRVFFLDYGNSDWLALEDLRPLPKELAELPAVAQHCVLSGVLAPFPNNDFSSESSYAFSNLAMGKELAAQIDLKPDGKPWVVTLYNEAEGKTVNQSINRELVRGGWVKLNGRVSRKLREFVESMIYDRNEAKRAKLGIYAHGGDSDDESDDDGRNHKKKGGKGQSQPGGRRRGTGGGKGSDRINVVAQPKGESKSSSSSSGGAPAKGGKESGKKESAKAPAKAGAKAEAAKAPAKSDAKKGKGK